MQSALGRSVLGDPGELTRLAAEKLKLWGLTQGQVDDILKQGKAGYRVPILAPIGGVVVRKNVVEGQYVAEGEPMFEVADLRHVWIEAQVYEDQFASVKVGQAVGATVRAFPEEVFPGTVAFIDPTFDAATRTVNVRYDLENHDLRLRPGMFAHVTLKTPVADTPAFRSRTAEARGQAGSTRLLGLTAEEQQVCPVTSARLGSMGDPVQVEVEGGKVWTCCGSCEPRLRGDPARYLARLRPATGEGVLTVPESAVIDTGTRKVVYVETGPGTFEGRPVVLGPRSGDRYPVLEGLRPGDRVAAAGAFLIDAETRLNPAAGASYHGGSGPHRDAATREEAEKAPPRPVASPPRSAAAVEPVHRH